MDLTMAQRLVDRRKAAGLSQEALADKLGVSRQAVSKWERSESSPDTDNLIALSRLYGVSLDELLYGEIENLAEEPAEKAANNTNARECTDAADAAPSGNGAGASDARTDSSNAHADFRWTSGINVDDPVKGEKVHVGWDGVRVENPAKGEFVDVGWTGVHVVNDAKNEEVHVGLDGMRINASDDTGNTVHTFDDGSVEINGERFGSWREAHRHYHGHDHEGNRRGSRSDFSRAWCRFPFPLIVIIAYLICGIVANLWGPALFLVFAIPAYYLIGTAIDSKRLGPFVGSMYSLGAVAWFIYEWAILGQPHPAWAILLTIPVVTCVCAWCTKQWSRRKSTKPAA